MDAPTTITQPATEELPRRGTGIDLRGDFVQAHGARVFLVLCAVGGLFLLPFALNNFVQDRAVLGVASLLVVVGLLGNAYAIARHRKPAFPVVLIFGPALVALGLAMYEQGLVGILWCYAAILLIHFVLPRGPANLFNGAIVLMAIPAAWFHLGPQVTARVGVTLALTMLFTNIFSSITDAQRRKEAQQRQRLDLLVRGTNAGSLEWEANGKVLYSQRLRALLGLPLEGDSSRWQFTDFVHPDDRERIGAHIRAVFDARARPHSVIHQPPDDLRLLRVSGHAIWVHTEGIAVMDGRGRTQAFICTFMDISEHVNAQQALLESHERMREQARQLERQNEQLREAIRVREEVERIARHDLKTPLASIASVPRLLRESGPLAAREEELLAMVENAALRVLSMVNLSLDLYRMEQGTYRLRAEPVDLGGLVRTVARELRGHADSKRIAFRVEAPREPLLGKGEELLCYSILANLMKNALEASPEGGSVTVRLQRHRYATDTVMLTIHNAGAVPEAVRENFFQKYASHGKPGGTGLGAYSARLMAQVQSGDLQMSTGESEGTTLALWLPLWPASAPAAPVPGAPSRPAVSAREETMPGIPMPAEPAEAQTRALLVDDDPYNILVLRSLLPARVSVDEAVNGRAALECVARARPDIVFLDLQMPVMGGPETIRRIRELQRERGQVPSVIVAFSAWDDEATRRQCEEAGFDHYLVKPATREEVLAVVRGESLSCAADAGDSIDDDPGALLPEFIASRRVLMGQLREAAERGDRNAVRAAAHMLAGSLGMYGFEAAGELSREISVQAQARELDWLQQRCAELAERFERDQVQAHA
ncbi:MAG TPA: response regulator [Ramlibacter sp.]|uniref:response regulator n=1 Tax=Ramlibacter sp. TaxID=1917967 RepID=UPI002C799608|nr:response regulator [Ramlibacter sp.]HVZ45715.1 response regulator [Ramlibacter sp.]